MEGIRQGVVLRQKNDGTKPERYVTVIDSIGNGIAIVSELSLLPLLDTGEWEIVSPTDLTKHKEKLATIMIDKIMKKP